MLVVVPLLLILLHLLLALYPFERDLVDCEVELEWVGGRGEVQGEVQWRRRGGVEEVHLPTRGLLEARGECGESHQVRGEVDLMCGEEVLSCTCHTKGGGAGNSTPGEVVGGRCSCSSSTPGPGQHVVTRATCCGAPPPGTSATTLVLCPPHLPLPSRCTPPSTCAGTGAGGAP